MTYWLSRGAIALVSFGLLGCDAAAPKRLVNGRSIPATLPAVREAVGSLPMNAVLSPDRRFALISDMGYRQSLSSIEIATGRRVSAVPYERTKKYRTRGLYFGLAVGPDNMVYAAQGGDQSIAILKLNNDGTLTPSGQIKAEKGDFPAGVALDGRGHLFVTSNEPNGTTGPLDNPGTLTCYDTATRKAVGRLTFETYLNLTNYPLAVAATTAGKVYVASQRDACVYVIDARDPAAMKITATLDTGAHPSALILDPEQKRLFVSNAGSDTVSQIDVATDKITATVLLRPEVARDVSGVTPLGMSLSPDGESLYVAAADLNAVAVLEMDEAENEHKLRGYIPAGWYPSCVVSDGKKLLIVDAKGTTTRYPNPPANTPATRPAARAALTTQPAATRPAVTQVSPNNLVEGDVLTRNLPTKSEIADGTKEVLELARLTPRFLKRENPLADVGVKHVIYIVKENRTYDQVLGDLPQGNGDPSRCIFGRDVTPNLHAIAERFVLLDNFYDCGEVSGDGWVWSTQAMANEYAIKNVPYQYSERGRVFDYEGTNNGYPTGGFPATGADGQAMSEHPILKKTGGQPVPDVAEAPGGHLWDLCRVHNVGFRNFGFFVSGAAKAKDGTRLTPENYPSAAGLRPGGHDLDGQTDIDYRRFDLDFADSDAPQRLFEQRGDTNLLRPTKTYGKHNAPSRFTEWKTEFDQMLAKDPAGADVPAMMFVRLGNDHTQGMTGGKHSPRSQVADNDYAVGQLVEAISHSPIWKNTAIFVIEDDAQNGPDHVDAHRSTCYVISPWVKRSTVDHTFHNTVSCIRTMELLLGLPPMNGYDAAAEPMGFFDRAPANADAFTAIMPSQQLIAERNPKANAAETPSPETRRMIEESDQMNFAMADKAPADRLTEIIWASVKGPAVPMPPTPHGPTIPGQAPANADDDD